MKKQIMLLILTMVGASKINANACTADQAALFTTMQSYVDASGWQNRATNIEKYMKSMKLGPSGQLAQESYWAVPNEKGQWVEYCAPKGSGPVAMPNLKAAQRYTWCQKNASECQKRGMAPYYAKNK